MIQYNGLVIITLAFCHFQIGKNAEEVELNEADLENHFMLSEDGRLICSDDSECPKIYTEGGKKFEYECKDNFCNETVYKKRPKVRGGIGGGRWNVCFTCTGIAGGFKPSVTSSPGGVQSVQIVTPNRFGQCPPLYCKRRRKCCRLVKLNLGRYSYTACPWRC